jgi:hypothetical protein
MLCRFTLDPAIDAFPVWTQDGGQLVWSSERNGRGIYSGRPLMGMTR